MSYLTLGHKRVVEVHPSFVTSEDGPDNISTLRHLQVLANWFAARPEMNILINLKEAERRNKDKVWHRQQVQKCNVVLVCLDKSYLRYVNGNPDYIPAAFEFQLAARIKPQHMIAIAFDKAAMKQKRWPQTLEIVFRGAPATTFPTEPNFDQSMHALAHMMSECARRPPKRGPELIQRKPLHMATPDHYQYIRAKALQFRSIVSNQVIDTISGWARDKSVRSRILLLTGAAYSGKSVTLARLCVDEKLVPYTIYMEELQLQKKKRRRLSFTSMSRTWAIGAAHFFTPNVPTSLSVCEALLSVAFQLSKLLPGLRKEFPPFLTSITDPEMLFKHSIVIPCSKIPVPPARILVVLDGIDQADVSQRSTLGRIITDAWADATPAWLGLIVSCRNSAAITSKLERCGLVHYQIEASVFRSNILCYLRSRLEPLVLQPSEFENAVLAIQAAPTFSYAWARVIEEKFYRDFTPGTLRDSDIRKLVSRGMDSILQESFRLLLTHFLGSNHVGYQKLLRAICMAREPLPMAFLPQLVSLENASQLMNNVPYIFTVEHESITFLSPEFIEFISDRARAGPDLYVNLYTGHDDLANLCMSVSRKFSGSEMEKFALKHSLFHLLECGRREDAVNLLHNFSWLYRSIDCGGPMPDQRYHRLGDIIQTCSTYDLFECCATPQFLRQNMSVLSRDIDELACQIRSRMPKYHPLVISVHRPTIGGFESLTQSLPDYRGPIMQTFDTRTTQVVCVVAENDRVISGGDDWAIWIWQLNTGKLLDILIGHTDAILSLAVNKGLLASGSFDSTIRTWDLLSGRCRHILQSSKSPVRSMVFKDDILISGSDDGTIAVWNARSGKMLSNSPSHQDVISSLSYDGNNLLSGSLDKKLCVWSIGSGCLIGKKTLVGHTSGIISAALSNGLAISVALDKIMRVWDVHSGKLVFETINKAQRVSVSGSLLLAASSSNIQVWNLETLKHEYDLIGHANRVNTIFPLNSGLVLSGSSDRTVRLWDTTAADRARLMMRHQWMTRHLDADDGHIVSGGQDGFIRVWNAISAEQTEVFNFGNGHAIDVVAICGLSVAAASMHDIKLWHLDSRVEPICFHGHQDKITQLVFTDRRLISSSNDCRIIIWKLGSQTISHSNTVLEGHRKAVLCLATAYDRILSGSDDFTARLWSTVTGKVIHSLPHFASVSSVALTDDFMITGTVTGDVNIWRRRTGQHMHRMEHHLCRVKDISLTPENKVMVTRDISGRVCFWNLRRKKLIPDSQSGRLLPNAVSFADNRVSLGPETGNGFSLDIPIRTAIAHGSVIAACDFSGLFHIFSISKLPSN